MTDCASQLWSQLCLDASLTVHDSNKILLSLSAQSSSSADIRPPRCIPSVCLEEIGMTFHFSTCRRTRTALRTQVLVSEGGVQHALVSTNPVAERRDGRYYSPLSLREGLSDTLTNGCSPWISGASSVNTSPMSSQGSISSNTHSTSSHDIPTPRHRYAIQEVKVEILVQLVDSSLRRMLSDYKPVRHGGVVLSGDAGCPKLAAISPVLFSPGYVKVKSVIEFYVSTDGLIPGGFAAYWATSHDSTNCVSGVSPHKVQQLETHAQAITRIIT